MVHERGTTGIRIYGYRTFRTDELFCCTIQGFYSRAISCGLFLLSSLLICALYVSLWMKYATTELPVRIFSYAGSPCRTRKVSLVTQSSSRIHTMGIQGPILYRIPSKLLVTFGSYLLACTTSPLGGFMFQVYLHRRLYNCD